MRRPNPNALKFSKFGYTLSGFRKMGHEGSSQRSGRKDSEYGVEGCFAVNGPLVGVDVREGAQEE
jgi:hypothetical protein